METKENNYLDIFNSLDFEKIIDHPNILIAANFWDVDRFLAAKQCYRFMREIDDFIDDYKANHGYIAPAERDSFITTVNEWIGGIKEKKNADSRQVELIKTFDKFRIPLWTMETFAKSMIYDISNDGFNSMESFLEYSKGASIAPASVFVHLCGVRKAGSVYSQPVYDVKASATPCAIFSYLVHIIRDFEKDQRNNLNYFADDLITRNGLSRENLHEMALGGKIKDGFRKIIKEYYSLADFYRLKTYEMIQEISPFLDERYQLSLDIIFNLYLMVFERINADRGIFSSEELNPKPNEVRERVYNTICSFIEHNKKHSITI
jgi:phytoene/squalene synthetase